MTPDDVLVVERSWAQLRLRRDDLVDRLAVSFSAVRPPATAHRRACWLVDSVAELVDLLTAPSQLGRRARQLVRDMAGSGLVAELPRRRTGVDQLRPATSAQRGPISAEHAWRHAWLLLSDVLAEEALSPFAGSSQRGRADVNASQPRSRVRGREPTGRPAAAAEPSLRARRPPLRTAHRSTDELRTREVVRSRAGRSRSRRSRRAMTSTTHPSSQPMAVRVVRSARRP